MIDCHNHSLPGIDDGAKDRAMSIEMLKVSEACGVKDVILTPHHGNGSFDNYRDQVRQATVELQMALEAEDISLRLHPGSELHFDG